MRKKEHKQKGEKISFEGVVHVTSRGIGFIAHEGLPQDVLIENEHLGTALHGDTVAYTLLPMKKGERVQGKIVRIIARRKTRFVGTIEKEDERAWVVPDDRKIHVHIELAPNEARSLPRGVKALVSFEWSDPASNPTGKILRVLGAKGNNAVEMEAILIERGFDSSFPDMVEEEARMLKQSASITEEEIAARRDMRPVLTCTIDPADAKDFDDALSFRERPDGMYEIGVHIADVSHYVRPGSLLDREALRRGVSVYLVDRTIPMLPEILSNDLCSLNPNEDKRTFSAVFIIDRKGKVLERWFGKTFIRSNRRFSYEEAQETIERRTDPFARELGILNALAKIMKQKRHEGGSIDFEEDEVKFTLDADGKPTGITRKIRFDTHKLIEEFMLLANREVAEYINRHEKHIRQNAPFVYRIHDTPDPEKMEELAVFLRAMGFDLSIKKGVVSSKDLNALFKQIQGEASEGLIKTAALRAMAKAVYSTKNIGHYGLAFRHYTHFTSPIRRYPDLLVHRLLERYLAGETVPHTTLKTYHSLATEATAREIAATDAERASVRLKQVEYMSTHIGETFEGVISGVTEWGIYIEEKKTKAEGMIRIRALGDDYFELDQKNYRLIGVRTKKTFTLGDSLRVTLAHADTDARTLDFALVVP